MEVSMDLTYKEEKRLNFNCKLGTYLAIIKSGREFYGYNAEIINTPIQFLAIIPMIFFARL